MKIYIYNVCRFSTTIYFLYTTLMPTTHPSPTVLWKFRELPGITKWLIVGFWLSILLTFVACKNNPDKAKENGYEEKFEQQFDSIKNVSDIGIEWFDFVETKHIQWWYFHVFRYTVQEWDVLWLVSQKFNNAIGTKLGIRNTGYTNFVTGYDIKDNLLTLYPSGHVGEAWIEKDQYELQVFGENDVNPWDRYYFIGFEEDCVPYILRTSWY